MAPILNLLPNLHRAGLVGQIAPPVSFRKRFLLLVYKFLLYLSIFYQYNLFLNLKSSFCGSENQLQSLACPDVIDDLALLTSSVHLLYRLTTMKNACRQCVDTCKHTWTSAYLYEGPPSALHELNDFGFSICVLTLCLSQEVSVFFFSSTGAL